MVPAGRRRGQILSPLMAELGKLSPAVTGGMSWLGRRDAGADVVTQAWENSPGHECGGQRLQKQQSDRPYYRLSGCLVDASEKLSAVTSETALNLNGV